MENIIDSHLNLASIQHGTIKYNFVTNKVYFDTLFVNEFELPKRCINGVKTGDKLIVDNSELHNLMKVIKKIKSGSQLRRFEYNTGTGSQYLFIKRMVQLEDEYIFAYFIAPLFEEFAPDYELNSNVIDLLTEISRTTYWYVDYSEGEQQYYSSSAIYGSSGEVIKSVDSVYFSRMDAAVEENPEYKPLADVVKQSIRDCEAGVIESFRATYPLKVEDEIVWVETLAKVASKDNIGRPLLLVGVDVIVGDNAPIELESELFRQVIDTGLNNADVGVWLMTIQNGIKRFRYNEKLRQLYRYTDHIVLTTGEQERYDDKFEESKERVLEKYPEYKVFFDDDFTQFTRMLNNEIEGYRSTLPFLDTNNKIVWLEIRATVASRDDFGDVSAATGVAIDITELFESQVYQVLFERTRTLINQANKQAIDMMELLIWSIDYTQHPKGDYFYGNNQYVEKLGLTKNEDGLIHIDDYFGSIIEEDDYSSSLETIGEYTKKIKAGQIDGFSNIVLKHRNKKTGEILYGSHSSQVASRDKRGKVEFLSGYFIDITNEINERKQNVQLQESIVEVRKFNKLAVQAGELMVFNINYLEEKKGKEIYANDYLITKLEIDTDDNHFSYETYRSTICLDEEGVALFDEVDEMYLDTLKGNRNSVSHMLSKHKSLKSGNIYYFEHNSHVEERTSDDRVVAIGGFLRDVTQDILNERKVKYLAEMDSLTDIYNRNKFEQVVNDMPFKQYTIVLFDIDGLKLANDIYGHQVGDDVLVRFSQMLKDEFEGEYLFRIGGDEFCVLIDTVNEDKVLESIQNVEHKMNELVVNESIQTGVSVGYEVVSNEPFEQSFMFAENQMYRKKLSSRSSRKSRTLETLMVTLSEKTEETNEHCERISYYAQETYKKLGFTRGAELYDIGLAGKLHDIGKITIPLDVLNKPGKLTEDEYMLVKKHSEAGYKIVFNIMSSEDVAEGVLYHHERFDGKGYPYGLLGKEIPLFARIISVCDAFDAMISNRPYSKAMTIEESVEELKVNSGTQFDPEVVNAFIEVLKDEVLLDK